MRLSTVTITGADHQTRFEDLCALSQEFSFVEWGLLLAPSRELRAGYPTREWLEIAEAEASESMRFSGHVCGKWARRACHGEFPWEINRPLFGRMQLNIAFCIEKKLRDTTSISTRSERAWKSPLNTWSRRYLRRGRPTYSSAQIDRITRSLRSTVRSTHPRRSAISAFANPSIFQSATLRRSSSSS
jgi:hypothetical protein